MPEPLSIVILDDNEADCTYVSELLGELGELDDWDLTIHTFTSTAAGRAYLEKHEDALLLLDYRLETESGLDVLMDLRDTGDQRPIIVLTGLGDERTAAELGRSGADEYLLKDDLTPENLRRVIQSSLQHHQLRIQRAMLVAQHHEAQKMEAIGVLAGGLAHDFNNMLASIMGFAELANMKYKRDQDIQRELDFVRRGCKQMADLVQQLVRFSMRNEPDYVRLRVTDIIEDTIAVLKHSISKTIKIELELDDGDLEITANAGMLQQTLLNICVNAADAMPSGGTLTLAANKFETDPEFIRTHRDLEPGTYVALSVRDTGIGIPDETLPRIFEPFYTTKPLSSSKGTGLGLATVWHNVKSHHGAIDVDSREGKGTTMTIYLPASLKPTNAHTPETTADLPHDGSEFVMVVDDEELVVEMAQALLEEMGYAVCSANSGQSALTLFRQHHHRLHAIILDISMPDMDGRNVFRRMKEIAPNVPILFATGHDTSTLEEELTKMGAAAVIQKPFVYGELSQKVRLAIDLESSQSKT